MSLARPALERALSLRTLNRMYARLERRSDGRQFCERALEALGIGYQAARGDIERIPQTEPLIVVANHPFGAVDGLILEAILRCRRPDVKFLGNYLLSRIPDLRDSLIPVDPFGGAGAAARNVLAIRSAIRWVREGGVLGIFPAGEVSHLSLKERRVADPAWNQTLGRIVRRARCPVLPIHFDGRNSGLFQILGLVHPALRTALLAREMLRKRMSCIDVRVGSLIPTRRLEAFETAADLTAYLRIRTYLLKADARPRISSSAVEATAPLSTEDCGASRQTIGARITEAGMPGAMEPEAPVPGGRMPGKPVAQAPMVGGWGLGTPMMEAAMVGRSTSVTPVAEAPMAGGTLGPPMAELSMPGGWMPGTPVTEALMTEVSMAGGRTQGARWPDWRVPPTAGPGTEVPAMRIAAAPARASRRYEPLAHPMDSRRVCAEVGQLPSEQILIGNGPLRVVWARSQQIPTALQEIGRLREIAFRQVGEGTGRELDLDTFDAAYLHLFVWNQESSEIVGAYRMGPTDEILPVQGKRGLYTSTLFRFRTPLLEQIGTALELGRSFVRPEYQKSHSALSLLWKGIGRFAARNPRYRMLFGPVSISNEYQSMSRQLLMAFLRMNRYVSHLGRWLTPRNPPRALRGELCNPALVSTLVRELEDVDELIREIEQDRRSIPVLLRQYLKLNGVLLGFNVDPDFGDVLDGLMLVDLTKVDRPILLRYMGRDGAAAFLNHHGVRR